jgi:SAM-dependent methyltransferase
MKCRACSTLLAAWGTNSGFPLLRCGRCGTIHADCVKPSEDLYADIYSQDEPVPPVVAASLDTVVRSMAPYRTHGRWLDIGFGQGALLDAAARGGFQPHGTELSGVALAKGEARGFKTAPGTEGLEDGSFDVVSLVELVEHVEDPGRFLSESRRVLRRGGCLYLTTPNAWSLNRWLLGSAWSVFCPPDHVTIFTPQGLRRLLQRAGFTRTVLRIEGLNPFEAIRALKKSGQEGFHRVNEGTTLCESLSSSPNRRGLKRVANAALTLTRLGDSLKARCF